MEDKEQITKLDIKDMTPAANWTWKLVVFTAQLISAASKEDVSNEQKKQLVLQEVMDFLSNFELPLPYFVLKELVSLGIDLLYGVLKDQLQVFNILAPTGGGKD